MSDDNPYNNYPIGTTYKVRKLKGLYRVVDSWLVGQRKPKRRYKLRYVEHTSAGDEYTESFGEDMTPAKEPLPEPKPNKFIDIVFDGPPSHVSGRFVEVEDESGQSISIGTWIKRDNGLWALRIPQPDSPSAAVDTDGSQELAPGTADATRPEAAEAAADAIRSRNATPGPGSGCMCGFSDFCPVHDAPPAAQPLNPELPVPGAKEIVMDGGAFGGELDPYSPGAQTTKQPTPLHAYRNLGEDVAAAIAHRACCSSEHDPEKGRIHGYCIVCGIPWPCETARYFLGSAK